MSNQRVKLSIPFSALIDLVAELSLDNKRQLWKLLDEQIRQTETIQETRIPYQAEEHSIQEGTTQVEILEELRKFPTLEQLAIIETVLHLVRQELQGPGELSVTKDKQDLVAAAKALLPEYSTNSELTVFTALDDEDFYAAG